MWDGMGWDVGSTQSHAMSSVTEHSWYERGVTYLTGPPTCLVCEQSAVAYARRESGSDNAIDVFSLSHADLHMTELFEDLVLLI